MYGEMFRLTTNYYHNMLSAEIHINEWVQDRLAPVEPIFRLISEYLDSGSLLNILIPVVGIFGQDLLFTLISVMSVANVICSLEKWIYPEIRPLWWLRELYAKENGHRPRVALQTYDLSCETSGGMPCSHSMSLTVFLIVVGSKLAENFRIGRQMRLLLHGIFACCALCMWLSRLYLASEFLHQCLLGTFQAISIGRQSKPLSDFLYSRARHPMLLFVFLMVCLAVAIYFFKLRFGFDPHYAVRQAFNWCPEPTYMRHESSPIFLLTRDLGIVMGVALSSPFVQLKTDASTSLRRRLKGISILLLFNYILCLNTPKQHGRLAFLAYEFTRNTLHSVALIWFLPKLLSRRAQK